MINSFQTVIPWWMQNPEYFVRTMSKDRLVDLKLKFTAVIRAIEELDKFASKVKLNNHLGSEYKPKQASMLNVNLQTANAKLHEATNSFVDHSFQFPDETFRVHINDFVMSTEYHGNKTYDYITDYEEDTTPPTSPLQYPLTADESKNDAGVDIEPVVTHVKRALEASPPMASRNSPDMPLLPQDSVEAIIESATTLSSQHKDKVYEKEEDKEGDENDDTDTEEEGVKAEGEGVRNDTTYMPVATDENMIVGRVETSSDYLISPLRKRYVTFFRSTMCTLKAIRCCLN